MRATYNTLDVCADVVLDPRNAAHRGALRGNVTGVQAASVGLPRDVRRVRGPDPYPARGVFFVNKHLQSVEARARWRIFSVAP